VGVYMIRNQGQRESRALLFGLLVQFTGMGVAAGGLALAVALRLAGLRLAMPLAIIAGVFAAGLAVTLLAQNLTGGLMRVSAALERLARAQPLSPELIRGVWPLTPLFLHLRMLGQQDETPALRERVLQQAGERAAAEVRAKLARDLHDSIKQQLFSISVSAAAAQARWESDPAAARTAIEDAQRGAREAQVEMSALLQDLRPAPLNGVGLLDALREQCEALGYRTGAQVTLDLDSAPTDYEQYPPGTQEALFRIAQEALANVSRHARASHVTLRLAEEQNGVTLEVRDDGQGFAATAQNGGTGMAGIRERALALGGHADISSKPGKGTVVKVWISMSSTAAAAGQPGAREEAIAATLRSGRTAHRNAEGALSLAGILILFGVPLLPVALSVAAALIESLRTAVIAARLSRLAGKNSVEARSLRHLEYDVSSGVLIFLAFCLWYLPVGLHGQWPADTVRTLTYGAVALCLLLSIIQSVRSYRAVGRWLALLPRWQRQAEIGQRVARTYSMLSLWFIIVVIALAVQNTWHLNMPALTGVQWSDDVVLAVLVIWPLILVAEYLNILRWRRQLARSAA